MAHRISSSFRIVISILFHSLSSNNCWHYVSFRQTENYSWIKMSTRFLRRISFLFNHFPRIPWKQQATTPIIHCWILINHIFPVHKKWENTNWIVSLIYFFRNIFKTFFSWIKRKTGEKNRRLVRCTTSLFWKTVQLTAKSTVCQHNASNASYATTG